MAVRTNATDVKVIISTDLADAVVDAFIADASLVIDEVLGGDTELSDDHKEMVEKWLTAHLLSVSRELQPSREDAGGASVVYQGATGKGLQSTFYGQQALALDTTGKLAAYASGRKAVSITAVTSFD